MRKKRNKPQSDLSIPIRTVRRIEKGSEPHINTLTYMQEMKPCINEMVKLIRLMTNIMEPECKKCNPDCPMYNKTHEQVMDAIRYVTGLC